MNNKKSLRNARTLLRQSALGVLSTHSKTNEGYPFGSVSTYMSTVNGDVIFYISDLAQHTKNILANSKMCLTVFSGHEGAQASDEDPNAGARLSLLGEAKRIDASEREAIQQRFFKLYPESSRYQGTHDFEYYKLRIERVRFIGGFGDINWISKEAWALATPEWLGDEEKMIQHMNKDHVDAMQLIYQHLFNIKPQHVEMLTLAPDGFFLRGDQAKAVFIPFDELVYDSQEVRRQLVRFTHAARAAVAA